MKPKRKKKGGYTKRQVVTEPPRRSILDVIETNLKIANGITFLHRIIYVGRYHFEGNDNIANAIEDNYKQTNSGYVTEPMSGILLYYQHYFCYIVEAPERMLHKHLTLLFEQHGDNLLNVKLLTAIHHIKSRFWKEWMSYFGRPPQRVEEIDPESNLENSMWYVKDCCEKLYKFANAFIEHQMKLRQKYLDQSDRDILTEEPTDKSAEKLSHVSKNRSGGMVERDTYSDVLPELKLLDFLVNCKHLKDLKQYHQYYEYIGQSKDFSRKSWPAPTTMIPYNVFDPQYNPVEDLPTQAEPPTEEEKVDPDLLEEI